MSAVDNQKPQRTALAAEHEKLGANFTDFGGWWMPVRYSSDRAEHEAVRSRGGLFDLSHMGEIWARGEGAGEFLDHALVGRFSNLKLGKARYSMICAPDGGIMDDLIVYRMDENEYLVVPNAANAPVVDAALQERSAGFDVELDNATDRISLIALQGPVAAGVLRNVVSPTDRDAVDGLPYYAAVRATVAGAPAIVARTGYTGEDGFEVFVDNDDAVSVWEALLAAGAAEGVVPAGLASRDSLRLEAGMPLYGHELNAEVTPFDAGLGPVVAMSKEDFVGREALTPVKENGPKFALVGLKGRGRRAARAEYSVLHDGALIGVVTSGLPSPTLGEPIALARVNAGVVAVGDSVEVDLRGKPETFDVVELPFYKRADRA